MMYAFLLFLEIEAIKLTIVQQRKYVELLLDCVTL